MSSLKLKPVDGQSVILPMLDKLRASFTIASPLTLAGKSEATLKVYMRVVNDLLSEEKRPFFNSTSISSLEQTVEELKSHDVEEQVWSVRKDLECIYDELIDKYCGLDNVTFDPIHKKISRCIEVCMPLLKSGRYKESNKIYRRVAVDVLSNARSISNKATNVLEEAIAHSSTNDDKQANQKLRNSLDYLYEEIRLPEVYCEPVMDEKSCSSDGIREVLLGGTSMDQMLKYDFFAFTDNLMGGKSEAEFTDWKEGSKFAIFHGKMMQANGGGFAGLRCLPKDQSAFKEFFYGCKGFLLSIRNTGPKTERLKMILASEKRSKAFNWQSDFVLPVKDETSEIYLPLLHFWPNMFGHVLANNGNVDLEKVDAIGLLLSKLTDNGKPNPEFSEDKFCIELESIHVVKNDV